MINKLDESSYIQWIEPFVANVLKKSNVNYKEVIINDMEGCKRIFLIIDSIEYTIRIWDFIVTKVDSKNKPCIAMINYTLFKQVIDGNYSEEIFEGFEEIEL